MQQPEPQAARPTLRKQLTVIARVVISLALVGVLIWRIDFAKMAEFWQQADRALLLAALLLQLCGVAISAWKWWQLIRIQDPALPYRWSLRTYFLGSFASNFLPTMVGGDAVRVLSLTQRTKRPGPAIASVLVERVSGFVVLTVIGWVGLLSSWALFDPAPELRLSALLALAVATCGIAAAISSPWTLGWLEKLPIPDVLRWRSRLGSFSHSLREAAADTRTLLVLLGISVLYQCSWVMVNILVCSALGLPIPWLVVGMIVPLSDIFGLVPIFWNSLGAREGVYIALLGVLGIPSEAAMAFSLMIFIIRLIASLPGGLLMARGSRGEQPVAEQP